METSVHPTENSRATQTQHPSLGVFFTKRAVFPPLFWPWCLRRATLDTLSPAPKDGGRLPRRLFPRTARGGLRRQANDYGRAEATRASG